MTQIYVAMITYLLLSYLKFMAKLGHTLQMIIRILQLNLFQRVPFEDLFNPCPHNQQNDIDIKQLSPYCKPEDEAYTIALDVIGQVNPQECVFIDDREVNLNPARSMGLYTILVGSDSVKSNHHAHIMTLKDLPTVLSI